MYVTVAESEEKVEMNTDVGAKKKKVKIQLKSPSQERSRQTVNTILEACARLIVAEGFYNVTTDKIAKEADVSIGSLYQFFGNKESVVSALIQRLLEDDMRTFQEQVLKIQYMPREEKVRGLIQICLNIFKTNAQLRSKIQNIQLYLTDQSFYQKTMRYYQDYIAHLVIPKNGISSQKTAYVAVNAFLGIMQASTLDGLDLEQEKELTSEIYRLLEPMIL